MIVVQLTGGMGNQMFQYATARALAVRLGTHPVLDSSWIKGRGTGVVTEVRRYELGAFALDAPLVPLEQIGRLRRSPAPRRRPRLRELVEPPHGQPCPAVLTAGDNTYLRGYWQNVTYFADAERVLREDFTFRAPIPRETLDRSTLPSVSVHVRRGDYVTDPGVRDRMGTLEPDYYRRALEQIISRVGDVLLVVFTDDPDWCEAHMNLGYETLTLSATRADGERWASFMNEMSQCDHHVLANSSFSWWGAWLNRSADKIVVAPRPWVLDSRWDDEHRIPFDWIRIDRDGHQADQPPSTTTFAPVT
jgi:hypothetical protein